MVVSHIMDDQKRAVIQGQRGPQRAFLKNSADLAIFGGSAGAGKTAALLLECVRHIGVPGYEAVVFRRTYPELTAPGGPWPTSYEFYPYLGGISRENVLDWTFPSGAAITFSHMQHVKDKYRWFGAQICQIVFDEIQTFEEEQVWFLLSRNRSTCGVRPYLRASCNPDADSWLAKFLAWWIDQKTGYAIPERAGAVRWFIRVEDAIKWADSKEELLARMPASRPLSVAFFPAKLADNPILTNKDPEYIAKLMAMPLVERERLLGGNWKIRPAAGLVFPREALARALVDEVPMDGTAPRVRFWDRASTSETDNGAAARTAGVLMSKVAGLYYVENVICGRWNPGERDAVMRGVAERDARKYPFRVPEQCAEEEPGSAGKDQAQAFYRLMDGMPCRSVRTTGDKLFRANPLASQVIAGNVKILKDEWTDDACSEMASFPDGRLKDIVDAASGAYSELALRSPAWVAPVPLTKPFAAVPNRPAPVGEASLRKFGGLFGLK